MNPLLAHAHDLFTGWSPGEWALFGLEVAVSLAVLWLAVRSTLDPREDEPDHVKRSILDDEPWPPAEAGPGTRAP